MNYDYMSGTSMACPHVAGAAALVWSQYPNKTRDWVRLWLRYTADDLGNPGFDVYYGYGRINARKAVQQTPPPHELIAYDWVTPPYVRPGASETINATILNFGENNETNITVQLFENDIIVDSTLIGFLAGGNSTTVSLAWSPTVEGLYNVTLYVVPVPGETSLENNVVWKYIYVEFPVKAVVLHSAGNIYGDIITNWQVLNSEWRLFGDTMVYIDYTTLNKEGITYEDIAATEADVLIISCAYDPWMGWQFTDSEIEAIKRYVYEGHGLIATARTIYYYVPNNNKLAPLFGLNEAITWYGTWTDLLHVEEPDHPLFVKVPNPFVFRQVATNIPSDWKWDANELIDGKYMALGHYQESAIVTYRGLVYISPWLEVIPPYYHHHLQLLYNAITWSQYQKPQHELIVSLEAPKRLNPGESTRLNATVSNRGRNNETNVELQLFIDGVLVDSVTLPELSVDSSYTLSYPWTPTVQGAYNITAYAPPKSGEEFTGNNIATKMVMVLLIVVRNILVYTDDFYVAPSSRYVIVALNNLGINYTHYADNPSGFGWALVNQPWDMVIVDHYNYYAVGSYWTELEEYVRDGGLLVLSTFDIDGSHSEPTTLWNTLGARWISNMQLSPEPVYRWMPSHPIFTFPNTVGDITSYISWGPVDYGDHVAATTGTPIAGFTTSPTEDYAAVVVGNIYPTVLFSFCLDDFRYDEDGDGKLDAIELWQNAIVYLARGFEHDLAVSLDAPTFLDPGEFTLLNATVRNCGLSNETDVELELLINGTIVDSVAVSELSPGSSYTFSYLWPPTIEGVYNITAYVPPVENETFVANNIATKFVTVTQPLIRPLEGQYANYTIYYVDPGTGEEIFGGLWNFTYLRYISPYQINITMCMKDPYNYTQSGWMIVNIFTRMVERDSGIYWAGMWYPGWIETNVTIGSTINLLGDSVTITDSAVILVNGVPIDCWEIRIEEYGYAYSFWYDKASGLWIGMEVTIPYYTVYLILTATNVPIGFMYEHDLAVMLDAPARLSPGTSIILNATVYNTGLSNETDVTLQLLINGSIVASEAIPELASGDYYTLSYPWTPLAEGVYNVTVYAPPLIGEEYIENNVKIRMVNVRLVTVALISDYSELTAITYILDSMGINYDIYNNNNLYRYTADLTLLLNYRVVVFYTDYRWITPEEQTALNSYLSYDGNLIVTGFDCLVSDTRLADVARSSTVGDNVGQPDLYVVDAAHPIVNGLYGSFPAGYHITGLYSDCDRAEADLARGAVTVAELADGYDKIIATDMLPGKVVFWNGRGDYDWTWNMDCQAMFKNMIHWFVAPEHDLAVTLVALSFLEPGDSSILGATVLNKGLSNETDVELQLLINGTIVDSVLIADLLAGKSYTLTYLWTPTVEGIYNITAYAPPVADEKSVINNVAMRIVHVFPVTGTRIAVIPQMKIVAPLQTFTLTINVADVEDMVAWQVFIRFDSTVLNCSGVSVPVDNVFAGKTILAPDPQIDNTAGTILYGATTLTLYEFTGSGVLCEINFTGLALGISTIELVETWPWRTYLLDLEDNEIPFTPLHGIVGVVELPPVQPDVAITHVESSHTAVYAGRVVNITVVARNVGEVLTTFNVTVYANATSIGTREVFDLAPGANVTLIFSWNTSGLATCQNFTIRAEATPLPGETNLDNNVFTDGTVKIKHLGDINSDGIVDMKDITIALRNYGKTC